MTDMPDANIQTHYEQVVELQTPEAIANIKNHAISILNELEGWCSPGKTSILVELIVMLKPKKIVEIGVFGGKSLVPMAYTLMRNGQGKIYGIDPWEASESAFGQTGANKDWWASIDHEKILKDLKYKIKQYQLAPFVKLIKNTSEKAAPIKDIDILHIDGNHCVESALIDLNKWVPLVKKGGLIIFDDMYWAGETAPVEWLDSHCIRFTEFRGGNRWGIWIKK